MKAVMLSIHPKWCYKIVDGRKTIEVRKTKPKLDPPFKCYIYMTSGGWEWRDPFATAVIPPNGEMYNGSKTVIGEFVCDEIQSFGVPYPAFSARMDENIMTHSRLTYDELHRYAMGNCLYAWHISDLKIYDQPKSLKIFRNPCQEYEKDDPRCGNCDYYHSMGEYPAECACEGLKPMLRPPQSWCYVEEME